ncbi:MAG: GNAT family N-acetyltransferase [Calditrichia bacterium]
MTPIIIRPVTNKSELLQFIKFAWKVNKKDPNWVPPLMMDMLNRLNKEKNPFFKHSQVELFLAYRGAEIVGRIAAIDNKMHNDFHQDKVGFFGFLEAENDREVFEKLLETAEDWLKKRGKDTILGPTNFSTNDEIGFLIDGFDTPPFFMMTHNPRYYPEMMDSLGYQKAKDVYAYYIDQKSVVISDKLKQISNANRERMNVKIRSVDMQHFDEELERVRTVYNNAWARNWGFVPLTPEEIDFIAADFKRIIDPELVLLAEIDGKPVGFLLALPNYNEVFAKIKNGKLFPFGWIKFLTGKKKIKSMRVLTLGIIQQLQQSGLGALFYMEIIQRGIKAGYQSAEMSWVLEDNDLMNRAAQLLGGAPYKTYRLYSKPLS